MIFQTGGGRTMKHETRSLSAAGRHLPVAMSAVYVFNSAVRFFSALHFYFFTGWYVSESI
jgi:hypothetical protein